jgi:hypothetical protein
MMLPDCCLDSDARDFQPRIVKAVLGVAEDRLVHFALAAWSAATGTKSNLPRPVW